MQTLNFAHFCPLNSPMKTLLLSSLFLVVSQVSAKTIYVNAAATGANNGNSWKNAYKSLSTAITQSKAGDNIWVAAGTYKPGNTKSSIFKLKEGVSLYGGFAGTETKVMDRNPWVNTCILSGEIGSPTDETDNIEKIMVVALNNPISISGFIFRDGYSEGFMGSAIEIASCSPNISYCVFENCQAMGGFSSGGAVTITGFDADAKPQFFNCIFRNNKSSVVGGAVHVNDDSNRPNFVSCLFDGNEAKRGGAINNSGGAVGLFNCTFVNNKADKGSATYTSSGSLTAHLNGIIWDGNNSPVQNISSSSTSTVNYCIIRGGFAGSGNLTSDPQFISSTNFGIKTTSPAKNSADPSFDVSLIPGIDLAGNNRVTFKKLDRGAYEYQCQPSDASSSSMTEVACKNFTGPSGKVYTETGIYQDVIANHNGCDSVITIDLTINSSSHSISEESCDPIKVNDKTYSKSGTYQQTLTNSKGCDSTLTVEITIKEVNTQVTQSGNTLTASANNSTYQWVNCDNDNSPIQGETNKTFTATEDGNYAVIVTKEECSEMSECIDLTPSNINSAPKHLEMSLYPNPFSHVLNVKIKSNQPAEFKIWTITGEDLISGTLRDQDSQIDLSEIPAGIYMMSIGSTTEYIVKSR